MAIFANEVGSFSLVNTDLCSQAIEVEAEEVRQGTVWL